LHHLLKSILISYMVNGICAGGITPKKHLFGYIKYLFLLLWQTFPTYQIHSNSNVYNLCRIAALEAELEEEQTQSEMLMERARKSQTSVEQLTAELATERGMQCSGSMTFWCGSGSGSADPCLCLMDPDPAIFVIDLQDASKKLIFFTIFSACYFLKVHLHHFSKINSQKEAVLRIRDVYPGSRILIFTHPGSRISDPGSRIPDPGSKNSNKRER
jgi:hypothetical protein